MSFRELRNLTEMMRSLGYHRLISMENFRTPNFQLVADILDWLIRRYDPSVHLPDDIDDERMRVEFIKRAVEIVATRTRLKLNPKKLYGADGYAAQELLKLAMLLRDAKQAATALPEEEEVGTTLQSKLHDLKATRQLCSQIVETGASLHDLLLKEPDLRKGRASALHFLDAMSRNLDSNSEHDVVSEQVVAQLVRQDTQLQDLKKMCEELQRDEKSTEQKIKKKRQDLDRLNKQLSRLVSVRPQFMDEYEKLEKELERLYDQYLERFRNLDYLEHELDTLNREEQEKMEENERALKRMQKRLREEEWRLLRGEGDDDLMEEPRKRGGRGGKRSQSRQKNHPTGGVGGGGAVMYGSMDGGDESDSEGTDLSEEIVSGSEDPPISMGENSSDEDILEESDDDSVGNDDELGLARGKGFGFR